MVDGWVYLDQLLDVKIQFDLARRAIDGFMGNDGAVSKYCEEELDSLRKMVQNAPQFKDINLESHQFFTKDGGMELIASYEKGLAKNIDGVKSRINQNELLLLTAIFERQMKEIHRKILKANPTILDPERKISLGRVVNSSFDQVLNEEIEREVAKLDRKDISKRCEYFDKKLNIDWYDGLIVPLLESVNDNRNIIMHENSNHIITEDDLCLARIVSISLVGTCVQQASILYPDSFKFGKDSQDGLRKYMEEQGRIAPKD